MKSSRPPDRVIAIDPGTTGMAYAVLDPTADPPALVDRGMVAPRGAPTAAERLLAIANALDELVAVHAPAVMALERLYFNKNVRTAMAVAEARGVALLCAARAGLAVAEYTPQEVKQSVTGSGAADKKQVQRMVQALLSLPEPITQDNVADAVAIGLTHLRRARFSAVLALAT